MRFPIFLQVALTALLASAVPDCKAQDPGNAALKRPQTMIVTYRDRELTIETVDVALSNVLRAVCEQTGAMIQVPEQATERITRKIGPGSVLEVLGALLNESQFNFLIEELGPDQRAPVRVVLSLKGNASRIFMPPAENALAIPPELERAREKGMAERRELIRQISDLNRRTRTGISDGELSK